MRRMFLFAVFALTMAGGVASADRYHHGGHHHGGLTVGASFGGPYGGVSFGIGPHGGVSFGVGYSGGYGGYYGSPYYGSAYYGSPYAPYDGAYGYPAAYGYPYRYVVRRPVYVNAPYPYYGYYRRPVVVARPAYYGY